MESTKCISGIYTSDLKEIQHGIPQVSVIDPTLILLYIYNNPIHIQETKMVLLANDTNI